MELTLDKTDKKILSYLYHNCREPLTKIAKACRLSRDQVEYRIQKYEKSGLIIKYATIFNYARLGYKEFIIVWLKTSSEESRKILKKGLENDKNVVTVFDVVGKFDLGADFAFKNKEDFQKTIGDILKKYDIREHTIFMTTYFEFFPLKEFELPQKETNYPIMLEETSYYPDDKELKILKALEHDGRAKIIDIAKATGISSELIIYKLKQLKKNKIILGNRIIFNLEKFGYFFGNLRIKLKNMDKETMLNIKKYCMHHPYINAVSFGIGEYNCLIQVFYKEEKHLRNSIKEVITRFREHILDSEILLIENEGKIKTLPS